MTKYRIALYNFLDCELDGVTIEVNDGSDHEAAIKAELIDFISNVVISVGDKITIKNA